MEITQPRQRTEKVITAIRLIHGVVAVNFLLLLVFLSATFWVGGAGTLPGLGTLFVALLDLAIPLFLAMKMSRGKNWARWVYVVLVLLTIPTVFCPDVSAVDDGVTFYDSVGYGILAVQLYVVLLLLHQESAKYFVPPAGERARGEALEPVVAAAASSVNAISQLIEGSESEPHSEEMGRDVADTSLRWRFVAIGLLISTVAFYIPPGYVVAMRVSVCDMGPGGDYSGLLCLTPFLLSAAMGGIIVGFAGNLLRRGLARRLEGRAATIIGVIVCVLLAMAVGLVISFLPAAMLAFPDC